MLLHLLKWQFQPQVRGGSWRGSIVEHRQRIQDDLKDSPNLKPYLTAVFDECYAKAVERAIAETELPAQTFPPASPYSIAEALDTGFLPEKKPVICFYGWRTGDRSRTVVIGPRLQRHA